MQRLIGAERRVLDPVFSNGLRSPSDRCPAKRHRTSLLLGAQVPELSQPALGTNGCSIRHRCRCIGTCGGCYNRLFPRRVGLILALEPPGAKRFDASWRGIGRLGTADRWKIPDRALFAQLLLNVA